MTTRMVINYKINTPTLIIRFNHDIYKAKYTPVCNTSINVTPAIHVVKYSNFISKGAENAVMYFSANGKRNQHATCPT